MFDQIKEKMRQHKTKLLIGGGIVLGSTVTYLIVRRNFVSKHVFHLVTKEVADEMQKGGIIIPKHVSILMASSDSLQKLINDAADLANVDINNVGVITYKNVK